MGRCGTVAVKRNGEEGETRGLVWGLLLWKVQSCTRMYKQQAKKAKTAGDLFLDNLGTVFLSSIALLILTLVRSSRGTTNKTNLRIAIEQSAALDPFEIDDFRTANDELTPDVFIHTATEIGHSRSTPLSTNL